MSEISKLEQNLIIKKIDNETVNVQITDNEMLMSIVGQFDQNLKSLAKETKTNIFFRGNSITCKGKKASTDMFCEAVLLSVFLGIHWVFLLHRDSTRRQLPLCCVLWPSTLLSWPSLWWTVVPWMPW